MKLLLFLLLPCLALSEVGDDFRQCNKYFLNKEPPQLTPSLRPTVVPPLLKLRSTGVPPQLTPSLRPTVVPPLLTLGSTAPICQCLWDDNGQKKYLFATLYNTAWRIPVYSAYVFEKGNTGRCDPWYIEPQLDGGNNVDPCMAPQDSDQPIGANQAVNRDYYKSPYDKGHLYPVQHTGNPLSMLATSTLTNAAPQDRTFNRGAWNKHEKDVSDDLSDCDKAYVVTGVVPDPTIKKIPDNNNPRVTVSKYYWSATCCVKNGVYTGQGYYGPNNNLRVEPLPIADLQTKLAKDYGVNVVIFPGVPILTGQKRLRTDCY